ncbi:MAG: class I SAM-dependent methyltransferase [Halobacteriovoraceae bacterium]|nr:class I SAM-dependent methyltransferase [Halobacteriovoraceae bacterium]
MTTNAEFWDKVSTKYARKAVPNEEIYQEKLRKTQQLFHQDYVVLEFGCGTGTTSLIHAPFVKSIVATDFSKAMIDIANQKKAEKNIKNVTFKVASIEENDFQENSYDMVMGHSILHLTQNNEQILKDAYRSLKPGGYFVSSSGCLKEMGFLIGIVIKVLQFFGKAPDINSFTSQELIHLHQSLGFKIIDPWKFKKGELFLIAQK